MFARPAIARIKDKAEAATAAPVSISFIAKYQIRISGLNSYILLDDD